VGLGEGWGLFFFGDSAGRGEGGKYDRESSEMTRRARQANWFCWGVAWHCVREGGGKQFWKADEGETLT